MSLFDIKNKLYKRKGEKDRLSTEDFRYSRSIDGLAKEEEQAEDVWSSPKKGLSEKTKRTIEISLITLGGIILVAASFWGIYKFRQSAFADERVVVSVTGPSETRSGKEASFEINWENDNRADLENAVLKLSYPENFKPENLDGFKSQGPANGVIELGKIKGHTKAKFIFSGKAFSPKGSLIYIQAELIYTPSNFNSRFTTQNRLSVNISSSPVTLDISYPQAVSNGDEIDYAIDYKNTGEEDFFNVSLIAEYPEGFEFISSNPPISEENGKWYSGDLKAKNSGKLTIKGRLGGDRNEVKTLKISIGAYENGNFTIFNEASAGVKIAASPLFISQSINNKNKLIANAGDFLKFEIFYRNDGDTGLRDVIVSEKLVGVALDFSSLDFPEGGNYDSSTHTIVWKAVDYPELKNIEPGQSGKINFNAKIKNPLPVKNTSDKNFIISSLAKIDSPDIPTPIAMNKIVSSNTINMKVNSQLNLNVSGYYNDETIPNSGPIPPRVDQETTYTIHWIVSNSSNNLEGANVEASLPSGISMTGKINPENENIKYNERTNLIIWDIGKLEAGVGVIKSAREVVFQIKMKPSIDQVGKTPNILEKPVFSGKDSFTLENLEAEGLKKTISLEEDKKIGTSGGRVAN